MRYYLKQNLPGIKAGEEVIKETIPFALNVSRWRSEHTTFGFPILDSELSDWIEERVEMWKPKEGENWHAPNLVGFSRYKLCKWYGDSVDREFLANGLVCPTPELAIELADRMLETAKKFWKEKE